MTSAIDAPSSFCAMLKPESTRLFQPMVNG
jgi:hypothetical protein